MVSVVAGMIVVDQEMISLGCQGVGKFIKQTGDLLFREAGCLNRVLARGPGVERLRSTGLPSSCISRRRQ